MVINTQPCCVRNPFSLSLNHFFGLSLCILRSRSIHRVHNLIAVEIRVHFEIKWVYVYVYVYVYMYVRMYVSIYIYTNYTYLRTFYTPWGFYSSLTDEHDDSEARS